VPVLILQHPLEAMHAKGSARLLHLSLARSQLEVGEEFSDALLADWLGPQPARCWLLYPATPGSGASCAPPAALAGRNALAGAPTRPARLVVLDGTWRKSLKLLMAHPLLQALPRWSLGNAPACSPYSALRKARQPHQLSTLEAVCHALASLEQAPQRYAPLLAGFEGLVAQQLRRTRAGAAGGHPASGGLQAAD
jgi:DTW domain-containing protein YfiP